MEALFESEIDGLELLYRGKVRDVYAIDEERLFIVTTDRLSAFDVVLPDPIPGKLRRVLAEIYRGEVAALHERFASPYTKAWIEAIDAS